MSLALKIDHLSLRLPLQGDRPYAIEGLSLSIPAGGTLCVAGESGSGKSALALAIMGLLPPGIRPEQGTIDVAGHTVLADGRYIAERQLRQWRGARMAMVFQEPMTALNPLMTCGRQVDEALRLHGRLSRAVRRARILEMFAAVQLDAPERIFRSYPHQLSGGQRQRVVLSMAMILRPALLICDEPTTALDVTTQAEILALITRLQQEQGTTVLLITHDLGVAARMGGDLLVMHEGQVIEQGAVADVLVRPEHPYTRRLLAAVPSMVPPDSRPEPETPVMLAGRGVRKRYRHGSLWRQTEQEVLRSVDLSVRAGEIVGVVGESGSGKSTLARCLVRLEMPDAGKIEWQGWPVEGLPEQQLRDARHLVQIISQDPGRSLNPRRQIGDTLAEGALNRGMPAAEAQRLARGLLEQVQLPPDALNRYPHQFSGGQRQRLAIARALACRPRVLIADEAVSALDVTTQAHIVALLRDLQSRLDLGIVFITHDLRVAAQLCDRVLVLRRGRVVEQGRTAAVFGQPRHEYTRSLLAAAPVLPMPVLDPELQT
ncbi:ABC transporter ATP-binding protein [Alcaligenaceae bacterium SJ-26]|nr:ABC transporter ATP-binding protein [Alcaligenaceae bacterium SJ-26]